MLNDVNVALQIKWKFWSISCKPINIFMSLSCLCEMGTCWVWNRNYWLLSPKIHKRGNLFFILIQSALYTSENVYNSWKLNWMWADKSKHRTLQKWKDEVDTCCTFAILNHNESESSLYARNKTRLLFIHLYLVYPST